MCGTKGGPTKKKKNIERETSFNYDEVVVGYVLIDDLRTLLLIPRTSKQTKTSKFKATTS